jgi:CHAT domain
MSATQTELTIKMHMEGNGAIHVSADGSGGRRPKSHVLDASDPSLFRGRLEAFTAGVARAVESGSHLDDAVQAEAYALHDALFQGALRDVAQRLVEASAQSPILVRLMIRDPRLQAVPWEALCQPQTHAGFLGTSDRMLLVRGVRANDPGEACRVSGAVRILAIAPLAKAAAALRELEGALADPIGSGSVEWLPPVTGNAVGKRYLFEKLRRSTIPHVVHFIGHGAVDSQGRPMLCLAEAEDGQEGEWILAESLALELTASFGGTLRLIVLEACEGAQPGAFGSAAEVLAREGAQAVVAHLWPVRRGIARDCSSELYRTLTGAERAKGDIAASLVAARRTLLLTSAEAFSPVVYLRSVQSALFDFHSRTLMRTAEPRAPRREVGPSVPPASAAPSSAPASLVDKAGAESAARAYAAITDLASRPSGRTPRAPPVFHHADERRSAPEASGSPDARRRGVRRDGPPSAVPGHEPAMSPYVPPVLVDEHGMGGSAPTAWQALGQYLFIAAPGTLVVAVAAWRTDLGRSFPSWIESIGDGSMLLLTVVAALLSAATSYMVTIPPVTARPASWASAATRAALLLCTCWAALVAIVVIWATLYASRLELGWKSGPLRQDVFESAIGKGAIWIVGLVTGAIVVWTRAATEADDTEGPRSS